MVAIFTHLPTPTTFNVNVDVILAHPGKQDEAFRIIQDVVHYVAVRKPRFSWSSLAKSTDGLTVVNVEAISDPGDVDLLFSDLVFVDKFEQLNAVSSSEFHTCSVRNLVLPPVAA